jgi:hypothetical protein
MEFNFENFKIKKQQILQHNCPIRQNISAQNKRIIVRHFTVFTQSNDGIRTFHLENDGSAKSWKEFGQWYSKILTGTTILPEETKAKMRALIGDEKNPIMKAKLIYDYVQQKSRYVSIQVGIGGWKPMDAVTLID